MISNDFFFKKIHTGEMKRLDYKDHQMFSAFIEFWIVTKVYTTYLLKWLVVITVIYCYKSPGTGFRGKGVMS